MDSEEILTTRDVSRILDRLSIASDSINADKLQAQRTWSGQRVFKLSDVERPTKALRAKK